MLTGALTTQLTEDQGDICDWELSHSTQDHDVQGVRFWNGYTLDHSLQPTGTPSHVKNAARRHELCSGVRGSNLVVEHGIRLTTGREVWLVLLPEVLLNFSLFFSSLSWSQTPVVPHVHESPLVPWKYCISQVGPPLVALHFLLRSVGYSWQCMCLMHAGCLSWQKRY